MCKCTEKSTTDDLPTGTLAPTRTLTLPARTPVPLVTTLLPLVGRCHLLLTGTSLLPLFNTPHYCI